MDQIISSKGTIDEAIARVVREEITKMNIRKKWILELDEAAEYLGVSHGTIDKFMADKKLACVRMDRRNRFDVEDLDTLIQESKQRD